MMSRDRSQVLLSQGRATSTTTRTRVHAAGYTCVQTTAMFDLTGRTALVTGSVRGLGYEMARGLATAGARVILNGRDPVSLDSVLMPVAGSTMGPFLRCAGGRGGLDSGAAAAWVWDPLAAVVCSPAARLHQVRRF
jgi:hypothetical protein